MTLVAVVGASLGSAAFFSLATALKYRSAGTTPHMEHLGARAVGSFVLATLRHPMWLLGILADVGGLGLQVLALHLGALSVVQPLLVSAVLFSLVVAHRLAGTRISPREVGLGSVLVAGVVGFLLFSGALDIHDGRTHPISTAVASGVAVVIVTVCVVVARARRHSKGGRSSAALLGVAAGVVYACTAALIKSCTHVLGVHGVVALLTTWQPYVLIVAGGLGLLLAQMAFQAGPLAASLPATAMVDPLASVLLGLVIFHEHLRGDPLSVVLSVLSLGVMAVAVVRLTLVRTHVEEGLATARAT